MPVPQVAIDAVPDAVGVHRKTVSGPLSERPQEPDSTFEPLVTPVNVPPCDGTIVALQGFGTAVGATVGEAVAAATGVVVGCGVAVLVAVCSGVLVTIDVAVTTTVGVAVVVGIGIAVRVDVGVAVVAAGGPIVSVNCPADVS